MVRSADQVVFKPFLLEKVGRGLRTPSAAAQTQHTHCLSNTKSRTLKGRVLVGAVAGLLYRQFSSVMVALSKLKSHSFFCGVHNSALHLSFTVTGCSR